MISIIIPIYKVEPFLPKCLDSLLAQTYQDFEIILVDDGSPDKSGTICDEYAARDKRIRVVHQENAGVSAARNNGMALATGKWISFVDPDDFVDSDYLERFELDSDDADFIVQGAEYYNHKTGEGMGKVRLNNDSSKNQDFKEFIEKNQLLSVGFPIGKAYAKELIDRYELKFDTSISFHEDHIFVLEYFQVANVIRLSDSTAYKYRCYHSPSSLSTKRHPWQKLDRAASRMLECLNEMKDRFLRDGSDYYYEIYHFAYSPKISAVIELFRTDLDGDELKWRYSSIINRKELKQWYRPTSILNRGFKIVMLYLPFVLTKTMFKVYLTYQALRK